LKKEVKKVGKQNICLVSEHAKLPLPEIFKEKIKDMELNGLAKKEW